MDRKITGVFFDLGGTLLFPDPERMRDIYARVTGLSFPSEKWMKAIHLTTVVLDAFMGSGGTLGDDWWRRYFGETVRNMGIPEEMDLSLTNKFVYELKISHEKENLWSSLAESAVETLSILKNEGYVLGVISNSDGRVEQQLREKNLSNYFSFVLDSFIVKCEKPDPKIFHLGLKQSGLQPSQVVYIGDFVNIDWKGATGVGMEVLIVDPLDLRKDWGIPTVEKLNLLPDRIGAMR